MVVIVLAVSTSDCESERAGSNPVNHPIYARLAQW